MPAALPRGTTSSKMTRRHLALVVVVLGAALLVFLWQRGGRTSGGAGGAGGADDPSSRLGDRRGSAANVPRPRVRLDGDVPAAAQAGDRPAGPRTYVTDTGNLVRDHRSDVREPVALPAPLPPEQRTMNTGITAAVYGKLAPVVRGCGADVPAADKGEHPVVHVTLTVDVAGEVLTATDATAVTTDVGGDWGERIIACVQARAAGLSVAAAGEPDRSAYVVQYPIRLRAP